MLSPGSRTCEIRGRRQMHYAWPVRKRSARPVQKPTSLVGTTIPQEERHGPAQALFDHFLDPAANGDVWRLFLAASPGAQGGAHALSRDVFSGRPRACRRLITPVLALLSVPGAYLLKPPGAMDSLHCGRGGSAGLLPAHGKKRERRVARLVSRSRIWEQACWRWRRCFWPT